jgi:iron complex outermembrane recepter protein
MARCFNLYHGNFKLPICVLISLGLHQGLFAQTLPGVTVSVSRAEAKNFDTPASVNVVNRDDLEDAKAQVNVSEVLGLVPGLIANNRNNFAQDLQISSRGFGARTAFGVRGIRIYVDGIPGNSPDGQGQVSQIDLGSARQIEVLRGPFASIYGNSSGGVINVTSHDGGPDTQSNSSVSAGSFGSFRLAQKFSGGSPGLNYMLDLSRFHTDGWREHSAATKDNLNIRLGLNLGANTLAVLIVNSVNIAKADDPQGLTLADLKSPRSVLPAALTFDTRKSTKQTQLGVNLNHRMNAENSINLVTYGGQRAVTQFQSITIGAQTAATSAGGIIDFERDYFGLDARYTFKRNLANGPLLVHVGVAADRVNEDRRGFENFLAASNVNPDPLCISGTSRLFTCGVQGRLRRDEDNRIKSNDQYAQVQWSPASAFTLHAGMRRSSVKLQSHDNYVVTGNPNDSGQVAFTGTTPMMGLTYNVNDRLNLYASWGKGFDVPTLNEIAYNSDASKSGQNFGLKPSSSQQIELGAKAQFTSRSNFQAALFRAKTEDEIVVLSNNGGRSRFQNAGRTKRDGLELAYSNQFAKGWQTRWAYTYLNATYVDSFTACFTTTCTSATGVAVPSGNLIPGVPRQSLYADVSWASSDGAIRTGLEWRAVGKVMANDVNSAAAAGYGTLAARASWEQKFGRWSFKEFVRMDNLTSKSYVGSVIVNQSNGQFYEPATPRSWLVGVTANYSFN